MKKQVLSQLSKLRLYFLNLHLKERKHTWAGRLGWIVALDCEWGFWLKGLAIQCDWYSNSVFCWSWKEYPCWVYDEDMNAFMLMILLGFFCCIKFKTLLCSFIKLRTADLESTKRTPFSAPCQYHAWNHHQSILVEFGVYFIRTSPKSNGSREIIIIHTPLRLHCKLHCS